MPGIPSVVAIDLTSARSIARRERSHLILVRLVENLPPDQRERVKGIPLVFDDTVGEVNAFAACLNGAAAMALTDGILEVSGNLARAKSYDEMLGTNKLGEYIGLIARTRQANQPLGTPPPGFYPMAQMMDGRRLDRELRLFDEQIAFILGHELAHHYLGHLPCTARSDIPLAEMNRALANVIPGFNQPNELGSDIAGVNNLLTAGRSAGWTEGGALLTLDFFSGLQSFSAQDIIFGFERSHPPPQLRRPVVQQTAATWRFTGGRSATIPGL